jgi:hypothetical protein
MSRYKYKMTNLYSAKRGLLCDSNRKDKTVNSLLEGSTNFFNLMPVAPPREKLIKHRSSNVYSCLSCDV